MKKSWSPYYYLTIAFSCIIHICLWRSGHNWGDDFSGYLMQTISIMNKSELSFIASNTFTITESSWPVGPIAYPWGFPMLLTPAMFFFGFNLTAFKSTVLFFFIGFLCTLLYGFKNLLRPAELMFMLVIFGFNPFLARFTDEILSDIPFLFFSTLAIFLINKQFFTQGFAGKYANAVTIGILSGFAFLIRPTGVILPAAILITSIFLLIKKKIFPNSTQLESIFSTNNSSFIYLNICLITLLPIFIFFLTEITLDSFFPIAPNTHLKFLELVTPGTLTSNARYYALLLVDFFSPSTPLYWAGLILYIITIPFFLLGIYKGWKNSIAILIYCSLTICLLIYWPGRQGVRYMLPITPFYIFFMIIGCRSKIKLIPLKWQPYSPVLALVACIFISSTLFASYRNFERGRIHQNGPFSNSAMAMYEYIKANSAASDVIIFHKPRVMHLMTNRPSIMIDKTKDIKYFDFIVINKDENDNQISPNTNDLFFKNHPVIKVFENNQFEIFKF